MLCFNFFFLPPVGTLTIADPQNWVALAAFLVVSVVASNLSARARARADEALARRAELARLFDLSRDILLAGDSDEGRAALVRAIARRFDLSFADPGHAWAGRHVGDDAGRGRLDLTLPPVAADRRARMPRASAWSSTRTREPTPGTARSDIDRPPRSTGALCAWERDRSGSWRPRATGWTRDARRDCRARGARDRSRADAGRAAPGRTSPDRAKRSRPRCSPRSVTTSARHSRPSASASRTCARPTCPQTNATRRRASCSAEVARLDRLFQNLLDMARLDAGSGGGRTTPRASLRDRRGRARSRSRRPCASTVSRSDVDSEMAVRVDPRLTAAALAHVLENAAQYAPAGTRITRRRRGIDDDRLELGVSGRRAGHVPRPTSRTSSNGSTAAPGARAALGHWHGPVDRARPARRTGWTTSGPTTRAGGGAVSRWRTSTAP